MLFSIIITIIIKGILREISSDFFTIVCYINVSGLRSQIDRALRTARIRIAKKFSSRKI